MKELFFEKMKNIGWNVSSEKISLKNVNIDRRAIARLAKAPKEFIDFISSYSTLNNAEDDIWFLSYQDYINDDKEFFAWNEFEQQSIKYADDDTDILEDINFYWQEQLPFAMSVRGEYSYLSIGVGKDNLGKIFHGIEPEYEDSTCIANNFNEFLSSFTGII